MAKAKSPALEADSTDPDKPSKHATTGEYCVAAIKKQSGCDDDQAQAILGALDVTEFATVCKIGHLAEAREMIAAAQAKLAS